VLRDPSAAARAGFGPASPLAGRCRRSLPKKITAGRPSPWDARPDSFTLSERAFRALADLGKAQAVQYNDLAWIALWLPSLPPDAVAMARKAVALTNGHRRPELHTLATLYAASGEPAEALRSLLQAVELDEVGIAPDDWLVIGKIAEQYGLVEDARAAYARVPTGPSAISSSVLARRWMAALPAEPSR
jgi:hypothetical protein